MKAVDAMCYCTGAYDTCSKARCKQEFIVTLNAFSVPHILGLPHFQEVLGRLVNDEQIFFVSYQRSFFALKRSGEHEAFAHYFPAASTG